MGSNGGCFLGFLVWFEGLGLDNVVGGSFSFGRQFESGLSRFRLSRGFKIGDNDMNDELMIS